MLRRSAYLAELRQTLAELHFELPAASVKVVSESSPDELPCSNIYQAANEEMLKQTRHFDRPLVHVTGEMRAMSDPFHQQVCRAYGIAENPVSILCYVGASITKVDALSVMRHARKNWKDTSWKTRIDAFHIMANGSVEVLATSDLEPIHYSVFGDAGVLLQSKHNHNEHRKFVWLLEDRRLNASLRRSAERSETEAKAIPSPLFRRSLSSICSLSTIDCLIELERNGCTDRLRLDASKALEAIGFIQGKGDARSLTVWGRAFLSAAGGPRP